MLQKHAPQLFYLLYFTVLSTIILPLFYIPMFLFNLPVLLIEDRRSLVDELTFLAKWQLPFLIVLIAVYKLFQIIKNQYLFFFLVFLFIAVISRFNFTVGFIMTDIQNALKLLFIGIVIGIYTSIVLTYFWKKIVLKKDYAYVRILCISLLLTLLMLFTEWVSSNVFGEFLLLDIYEAVGEFLLKYFAVNIFYGDYAGFVGVFLSLFASISSLIVAKVTIKK